MGVASSGLSGGAVQSGGAVPEGGKALLFTVSLEGLQAGPRGLQALQGSLPGPGTGGRVSAGVFVHTHTLFIIGDWNAKVGNEETPGIIHKFGLGVQNEAGQR